MLAVFFSHRLYVYRKKRDVLKIKLEAFSVATEFYLKLKMYTLKFHFAWVRLIHWSCKVHQDLRSCFVLSMECKGIVRNEFWQILLCSVLKVLFPEILLHSDKFFEMLSQGSVKMT